MDRSQVFADTQRIDLFDDPAWEVAPVGARRVTTTDRQAQQSWWAALRSVVGRPLLKRGQHSQVG